ncbi:MAG TPA: alpha/beta hydrolase [Polyangia bacterium]
MSRSRHSRALVAFGLASSVSLAAPAAFADEGKTTIVLVHGAFADASAWQAVIPTLQKAGHKVIAVQSPLRSFEDDVATTRRAIEGAKGPVVAVGHSYGGAVITGAASGAANVKALVYVTAFAPEANEKIGALYEKDGKPELLGALVPDSAGLVSIDPVQFRPLFAADVPAERAAVMAATQKPIAAKNFEGAVATPAWKTIPSWYLVAQDDRAIPVALQQFMAKRINAKVANVRASHVPFTSKPKEVAKIILDAAASAK